MTPSKRPHDYNAVAITKITDLKKIVDNDEFVQWISATERSGDLKKTFKDMIEPLKMLFLRLGVEINENISNLLTLNPDSAVQEIRQGIDEVTKAVKETNDDTLMDKLQYELKLIQRLGGLAKVVPTEGLTFTYTTNEGDVNVYKYTGIFAPVNQILGLLKFAR